MGRKSKKVRRYERSLEMIKKECPYRHECWKYIKTLNGFGVQAKLAIGVGKRIMPCGFEQVGDLYNCPLMERFK